jgi:hypothetical protein
MACHSKRNGTASVPYEALNSFTPSGVQGWVYLDFMYPFDCNFVKGVIPLCMQAKRGLVATQQPEKRKAKIMACNPLLLRFILGGLNLEGRDREPVEQIPRLSFAICKPQG